jgi:tetratricopeptide (TPR) repeat protein
MDTYERAIRALVRPGDVVLDLGAGTGVLGFLALRRGAARVHAIESMPVAGLAVELARQQGFGDRWVLHRAEATTVPPPEQVDLVLSDFMGRFVVDDGMLWAVTAAGAWMRPQARFLPSEVRSYLAPVAIDYFPELDLFEASLAGFDWAPARILAEHAVYATELTPNAILATPVLHDRLVPPRVGAPVDRTHTWTLEHAGRLRGVAGWFVADLAPGIALSTAPGEPTHWRQMLFPLPAIQAAEGDLLRFRLHSREGEESLIWCWEGALVRGGETLLDVALDCRWEPGAATATIPFEERQGRAEAETWNQIGTEAFEKGDHAAAARAFERAIRALTPGEDDLAPGYWESLGLAYLRASSYRPAVDCFLRALDGAPGSREPSARFLVDACLLSGLHVEGERALASYEAAFGPRQGPPGAG